MATAIVDDLSELQLICVRVSEFQAEGRRFLLLGKLTLPPGCTPAAAEGLLCPQERDGYATRLFLSEPISGKGTNWSRHRILDREWHTWSWQGISANQRLAQILAGHLKALQ